MTESNAGWRVGGEDPAEGNTSIYKGNKCVGIVYTEFAAEIVANAGAARCWKACVENEWHIYQSLLPWTEQPNGWWNCRKKAGNMGNVGSGPTPIEAVEDALAALRLKGAGS